MDELAVKYHDFEEKKEQIKKFSEETTTDLDLKKVNDSKGFGEWFGDFCLGRGIGLDHPVKGKELNELTTQIQSHLQSINNTQIKLIKEFGQVYSLVEALDKGYIQAILVSMGLTEKTSQSIPEIEAQIKKNVQNQRGTLEILRNFKQKIESYVHLGDIDELWDDFQKWSQEVNLLSNSVSHAIANSEENTNKIVALKEAIEAKEKIICDLLEQLDQQIIRLESVALYTNELEKITHLHDVDEMWESLSSAQDSLRNVDNELTSIKNTAAQQQAEIESFLTFMEKLSGLEHLSDVDAVWNRTEDHHHQLEEFTARNEQHAVKLDELKQQDEAILDLVKANKTSIHSLNEYQEKLCNMAHLDDIDEIWQSAERHAVQLYELQKQSDKIQTVIQSNKDEAHDAVDMLMRKIKYAYWLAGSAVGLAIIELLVILTKVI